MGQAKQFDPAERLDLAVDAFWQHGFDGSLYGTCGDKRQLFLRAVERYMATVSAEAIRTLGQGSGLTALGCYFDRLITGIVEGKRCWRCLVTNSIVELAPREPAIAALVEQHLARLETAFAGAVDRARRAGEIPADSAPDGAGFLVCMVQGLNVLAKTKPSRDRLERIVATALSALSR